MLKNERGGKNIINLELLIVGKRRKEVRKGSSLSLLAR